MGSPADGPPKRSELDSRPLPVPFGGGGVGRAAFGVGAEDDDLDCTLISSGWSFGSSHVGSTSIAPSMLEIAAGFAMLWEGDACGGGGAVKVAVFDGGGDCC